MHCSKNQKYKLLKSAMVCLLMGAAFVSTDGAFFAAHAADTAESDAETDSLARVKLIEAEIAKKHSGLVYEPIEFKTTESAERNLGANLHTVSDVMGTVFPDQSKYTWVNNILLTLADKDNSRLYQTLYEMTMFCYKDASSKININQSTLLEPIAGDFYGMKALFDIAAAGLTYKDLIIHLENQSRAEYKETEEKQALLLQGAAQVKDEAVSLANATFESVKSEIEGNLKRETGDLESTINGLELENKNLTTTKTLIEPARVSKNKQLILEYTKKLASAKSDAKVKIEEAIKVRDEAILKANEAYDEIKVKQEKVLVEADAKSLKDTKDHKYAFSWMISPLGGTYGYKTVTSVLSRQYTDRKLYPYHNLNRLLVNTDVSLNARLSLISAFVEREADPIMLHLMGVQTSDMEALKERLKKESKKKLQQFSSVASTSSSNGSAQKKSSK